MLAALRVEDADAGVDGGGRGADDGRAVQVARDGGIGRLDRQNNTLQSALPVPLQRLDFIAFSDVGPANVPLLQRVVAGELGFRAAVSQLEGAR